MRITITTVGSRGDVHPYVALGSGLRSAGYDVRIAAHSNFRTPIADRDLEFTAVAGDPKEILKSPDGQMLVNENYGRHTRFARQLWKVIQPHFRQISHDHFEACQDADIIITSQLAIPFAYSIAEKLRLPLVRAFTVPLTSSRAYPAPPILPSINLGGRFNLLTHALSRQLYWLMIRAEVNAIRQEQLQLPELPLREPLRQMNQQRWPLLYGYSPSVVPRPHDWQDWIKITGYWFLDHPATWSPPPDLVDFIESGPPPVFIGFGSMPGRDPEQMTRLACEALKKVGQRGVLAQGWGGLAGHRVSDDVHAVSYIPFDWLLPRMAAAVHHGGAGTTATGLRAGIPNIIIPHLPDQRFWGQRVYDLGAGPRPFAPDELSVDRLAAAIHSAMARAEMRKRAADLGALLRAEHGVERAVQAVDEFWKRR